MSKSLLEELKRILSEDYRTNFSQAEVVEVGKSLVGFFEILTQAQNKMIIKNRNYENI